MAEKNAEKIKIGTAFRGYFVFPLIFACVLLAASFAVFYINGDAGLIAFAVFVLYAAAGLVFYLLHQKALKKRLLAFARNYETFESDFIRQFPLPYAMLLPDGTIIQYNDLFSKFCDADPGTANIRELFKELDGADLDFEGEENQIAVVYDKRNFRLHFKKIAVSSAAMEECFPELSESNMMIGVYMHDETEIVRLMREISRQQLVIGNIYVDNYEETLQKAADVQASMVAALIEGQINDYFGKCGGIVCKLEKDRYFAIFKKKHLQEMQSDKFSLLDSIKGINTGSSIAVTVSMGIGASDDYIKGLNFSRQALELALGRGGDQAVVKEGERIYFYGGKTKSVEKNTRVKARITAQALKEVITGKERVVIMGHKTGDIDCFGASIGIYNAAKALGKKAYIVLNVLTNTVQPILELFLDDPDFDESAFVAPEDALDLVTTDTALIIVDVNRPDIFECPELVHKTDTIVMIDHHLQSGDHVDNVVLSYIEPTASSASEMVAELLRYISDQVKLSKLEAEAMYAGILIDTNYFSKNTGVKTFETAAFLKRFGVDSARVKSLFNDTLEDFKLKAEVIKTAEVIEPGIVMAVCPPAKSGTPTVVAAQVANELLDISGVSCSFVLLDYNGQIYISARSNNDVNVQLVMERMGGGGHLNTAGAQLADDTIESAKKKLQRTVRKMIEDKEL